MKNEEIRDMDRKAIKIERSFKTEPTLPTKTLEQLQQWPPKQGPYFSFWCSPTIGGGLFSGLNSSNSPQNRAPYFLIPSIFSHTICICIGEHYII